MRRIIPVLVLLALSVASPLFSQEPAGLYAQIGSVGGIGYFGRYISVEPALGWRNGWFTVAAVPRLAVGTSQFDIHVVPQTLVQLGTFYLQMGWVLELVDETSDYQLIDNGPTVALGIRTPLVELSGGTLVLDTGFETFLALEPDQGVPTGNNLAPDNALGDLVDFALSVSAPYSLLRLGLVYTFGP